MVYTDRLPPEWDKAIPLENLTEEFNEALKGTSKRGKELFFEYTVELVDIKDQNEAGQTEDKGAILLYPDMLKKRLVASVDLLMIVPLIFEADTGGATMTIEPDTDDEDLFRRADPDDNEYFDMVTSFGFDINVKNVAGLSSGQLFLKNKTGNEEQKKWLVVDFAKPHNHLSLNSEDLKTIRDQWPFIPQALIEFEGGEVVRLERSFNIELQSVTIRAGGEYTFETGL
jgi:hypothetical protein